MVSNPGYTAAQSDSGDLAVLLVDPRQTRGITPAVLPAAGLLDALAAKNGLKKTVYTAVGYGLQNRVTGGGTPFFQDRNPVPRMYAFSSFDSLNGGYLRLSMNPATGDGGTCFGDSGGPNFLNVNGTRTLVAITITGDAVCRATNVVYRLDIASARAFLAPSISLPLAARGGVGRRRGFAPASERARQSPSARPASSGHPAIPSAPGNVP